mmetsp:Transcript_62719/g.164479  ORF Transcript_62719/g.164479 Transcript_62719/m.164479 type:complete len:235 (-) Transcript_62719:3501-4205(-)
MMFVQVLAVLAVGLLKRLQLCSVLVRRVAHPLLQIGDAVGQARVQRRARLLDVRQVGGVPLVHGPEGLQLLGVLVCGVAKQLLDVVEALAHARMVHLRSIVLPGMLVQGLRVLRVRRLQRSELLRVPVGGVAEQHLQVVDALAHAGVVRVQSLEGIQVLGLLAVGNLDLGVGLAKGLQLLEVFVGVVPKQLLQVVHSLGQGRMVPMGQPQIGQLASMLVVGGLQSLELLGMAVC